MNNFINVLSCACLASDIYLAPQCPRLFVVSAIAITFGLIVRNLT